MEFLFKLALALGRPVGELLRTMSAPELRLWQAFSRRHPFGDERADWRHAIAMSFWANALRGKGKATVPPEKFLLKFEPKRKQQTAQEMFNILMAGTKAVGGKVIRRGE